MFLLNNNFVGVINVGQERTSLYDLYKKYKPEIKPASMLDSPEQMRRAKDSSLDIALWKKLMIKNGN